MRYFWQKRSLRYAKGGIVLVLVILLGVWPLQHPKRAPAITFTTITGRQLKLQELHGKPVIVTFWATDCATCVSEIPHLSELYQRYHAQGLEIIAVAMYYDLPSHVIEMARQKQIPYLVALDLRNDLAQAFDNVQLTPSTFLISPEGRIVIKIIGILDFADLQNQIAHYL